MNVTTFLGFAAATFGVAMGLSPLLQLRRVVARGSSADISIPYLGRAARRLRALARLRHRARQRGADRVERRGDHDVRDHDGRRTAVSLSALRRYAAVTSPRGTPGALLSRYRESRHVSVPIPCRKEHRQRGAAWSGRPRFSAGQRGHSGRTAGTTAGSSARTSGSARPCRPAPRPRDAGRRARRPPARARRPARS